MALGERRGAGCILPTGMWVPHPSTLRDAQRCQGLGSGLAVVEAALCDCGMPRVTACILHCSCLSLSWGSWEQPFCCFPRMLEAGGMGNVDRCQCSASPQWTF